MFNILCLISRSLYILTPCVFAVMKKKGEERKTGCFSVPSFSLRPSIGGPVVSATPFVLGASAVRAVRQRSKPAEPACQTLADSLYPAPVLIAICLDPATDPTCIFLAEGLVFHTHLADYRRIRIIEPQPGAEASGRTERQFHRTEMQNIEDFKSGRLPYHRVGAVFDEQFVLSANEQSSA